MNGSEKPLILLLGDSLIDYGEWHRRLSGYRVISSGVPGERTEGLLQRLPIETRGTTPDALLLMTGTNNIVFGDMGFIDISRQIATRLKDQFPHSPILVTSLLPYEIPGIIDTIHVANEQLRLVCNESGCNYFDLCSHFESSFDALFDFDGIHLSNSGYQLWASVLAEFLRKLLAKDPD